MIYYNLSQTTLIMLTTSGENKALFSPATLITSANRVIFE